jgi:uncharacterized protein YndB with AHSA1/START domain
MATKQNTTKADGTLDMVDGRPVLRFERHLAHPIERVWDAITTPAGLAEWWGDVEVELDLVEGGTYRTRTVGPPELVDAIIREGGGEEHLISENRVTKVEPPRLFEHTFGADDSIARWELAPDGDGCRLVLTHTEPATIDPKVDGPRDLAGWHSLLEQLELALAGTPHGWRNERWETLRDHYLAKLT